MAETNWVIKDVNEIIFNEDGGFTIKTTTGTVRACFLPPLTEPDKNFIQEAIEKKYGK